MNRTPVRFASLLMLSLTSCVQSQPNEVSTPEQQAAPRATTDAEAEHEGDAARAPSLPVSTKGYELYAWDDESGALRFMLITGTNRDKTPEEIMVNDSELERGGWVAISGTGLAQLRAVLLRVPAESAPQYITTRVALPALSAANKESVLGALVR